MTHRLIAAYMPTARRVSAACQANSAAGTGRKVSRCRQANWSVTSNASRLTVRLCRFDRDFIFFRLDGFSGHVKFPRLAVFVNQNYAVSAEAANKGTVTAL